MHFRTNVPSSLKKIVLSEEGEKQFKLEDFAYLIFPSVAKVFELRHIYSHELSPVQPLKIRTVKDCLIGVGLYLYSTEQLVQELIDKT